MENGGIGEPENGEIGRREIVKGERFSGERLWRTGILGTGWGLEIMENRDIGEGRHYGERGD